MPDVDWQPWHTTAFLDAQRRRRPVLLLLETVWSPACAHARADVFTRPDVVSAIGETSVPVCVDADRRPDIADRYGLGHWPTLLFLTPEGEILTGGTRLDGSLAARIREVAGAFSLTIDRAAPSGSGGAAERPSVDDAAAMAAIVESLRSGVRTAGDPRQPPQAPSASATLFALAHATVSGDSTWADAAAVAIDRADAAVGDRSGVLALVPAVDEWPAVARLEDQAEWTRTLARALRLEAVPTWRSCLDRLTRGLATFRRPDGHWRPWGGATRVVLVDASARACRAQMAAADALDRPDLAREAIESLEVLAPVAYARASGVTHVIDEGRARGPVLLDDAMVLAHALLDGEEWRGDGVYRDLADELLRTTLVRLRDSSDALVDRLAAFAGAGQVGRLADPHHPLAGNAEAVRLLCRLRPGDPDAAEDGRRILRAVSAEAAAAGSFGAVVGLAWHAVQPAGSVTAAW